MPNSAVSVKTAQEQSQSSYILYQVGRALQQKQNLSQEIGKLSGRMMDKALSVFIYSKIYLGTLSAHDLRIERTQEIVEEYLVQKYPDLHLRNSPANTLLYGYQAREVRESINSLIESANLEPIDVNRLNDPNYLNSIEKILSRIYPELDMRKDPAKDMLQGKWQAEMDQFIDSLITNNDN